MQNKDKTNFDMFIEYFSDIYTVCWTEKNVSTKSSKPKLSTTSNDLEHVEYSN